MKIEGIAQPKFTPRETLDEATRGEALPEYNNKDETERREGGRERERERGREGDEWIKIERLEQGEGVRVETDFTLQGPGEKLSLAGWLSKAYRFSVSTSLEDRAGQC